MYDLYFGLCTVCIVYFISQILYECCKDLLQSQKGIMLYIVEADIINRRLPTDNPGSLNSRSMVDKKTIRKYDKKRSA